MKVKQETTLFKVLTGSHLYGTATSSSDYDYKAVCLPALDELLINTKITNRKEKPEGVGDSDKMIAGETETEYLPLQVFMNDFFDGQTYALEVAFAARQGLFELPESVNDDFGKEQVIKFADVLIDRFLTRNVKKMVGYAVSQSKLYGLKTQRFTTLNEVLTMLENYLNKLLPMPEPMISSVTLKDASRLVEELVKIPHVKNAELFNAKGGAELAPGIDICGKQFPLTARIVTVIQSVKKSLSQYGERVKQFDGEGVDWKALSHAIRITEQVIELSTTGQITFPRPSAQFLLDVKSGKLALDEATEHLNSLFNKVDEVIEASVLRERTEELEAEFKAWKIEVLRSLYDVG